MLGRREFLAGLAAAPAGLRAASKLRVLIIDGVSNHDWQTATRMVKDLLAATGRFSVNVFTSPAADAPRDAWNLWLPPFHEYDVVLNTFNGGHKPDSLRWPMRVENSLEDYVKRGGGLVVYHAANNAFLDWPAYNQMIGLGWRDPDFGPGLHVTRHGAVVEIPKGSGMKPGHGPRHDFPMHVLDRKHPITKGMPEVWMHPSEQLTHGQHGPAEDLAVLTYAWSKDSKQNEPMDWVRRYGKGRVYTTMLGHTWKDQPNPNLECVGFRTLLARGVEWAATGRVSIPVPSPFPGPDRIQVTG